MRLALGPGLTSSSIHWLTAKARGRHSTRRSHRHTRSTHWHAGRAHGHARRTHGHAGRAHGHARRRSHRREATLRSRLPRHRARRRHQRRASINRHRARRRHRARQWHRARCRQQLRTSIVWLTRHRARCRQLCAYIVRLTKSHARRRCWSPSRCTGCRCRWHSRSPRLRWEAWAWLIECWLTRWWRW